MLIEVLHGDTAVGHRLGVQLLPGNHALARFDEVNLVEDLQDAVVLKVEAEVCELVDLRERKTGVVVLQRCLAVHAGPDGAGHQVGLLEVVSILLYHP